MNPNNGSQGGGTPNPSTPQDDRSAAANVIRSQISALYGDRPVARVEPRGDEPQGRQPFRSSITPASEQAAQAQVQTQVAQSTGQAQSDLTRPGEEGANPYERTHEPHPQPQAEQWKAYHSAWQNYYQQYYEAYYAHQQSQKEALLASKPDEQPNTQPINSQAGEQASHDQSSGYFSAQTDLEKTAEDLSKDQALYELREKLLGKVRKQATKVRRSKHFVPIVAALTVVLVFAFLQYNRVLFAAVNAYVSPGSIDPQNIVLDPNASIQVSEDPRLIIPKINVDVPVLYDVGTDYDSQMSAMESGVAHFPIPGANSHPGEIGNTVLSGHSSNDLFDPGEYKFIFAQLDKLNDGDTIYANYQGIRYTYVVTKKEVVMPTEVGKLIYETDKPVMTLITCTPLGTSQKRLLVTAEQVSPDPTAALAAPEGSGQGGEDAEIPGNSKTLFERMFGG